MRPTLKIIAQESIHFNENTFGHFVKISVAFFFLLLWSRKLHCDTWHRTKKAFLFRVNRKIHVDIITEIQHFNVTAFLLDSIPTKIFKRLFEMARIINHNNEFGFVSFCFFIEFIFTGNKRCCKWKKCPYCVFVRVRNVKHR